MWRATQQSSTLVLALLAIGCGVTHSPTSPTVDLTALPSTPPGTVSFTNTFTPAAEGDPYARSTYTWHPSQYEQTIAIHNGSDRELIYTLAVFETPYAEGHPRFLETQTLFSVLQVTVPAGLTTTATGQIPEGCDRLNQADVYAGLNADDVRSGKVNIHPTASPKVYEVTFKFGKSRAACPTKVPVPPNGPTPAPQPPTLPPSAPAPPPVPVLPCDVSRAGCQ